MRISVLVLAAVSVVTGCAGGGDGDGGGNDTSGVAGSTRLTELTPAQVTDFCEWAIALPGNGEEQECGDGLIVTVGFGTQSSCEGTIGAAEGCSATVTQGEACARAGIAEACTLVPAACEPVFACSFDGPDFICDDGTAIPSQWECDGENDCDNGEDEANCGV